MQTERNTKKTGLHVFFCIAEVQPTLSKGSARRAQNKTNSFVFYAEAKPILSKDSANLGNTKKQACVFFLHCRGEAYLKIGMLKLLFQCGSRGCIKIVKDAGKGLRSCPIMLNRARRSRTRCGTASTTQNVLAEGEHICIQVVIRPLRGRQCRCYDYTGFGSLEVASPGVKHNWAAPQPIFPF